MKWLDNFTVKTSRSKHEEETRQVVLESSLWEYYNVVENEIKGIPKVNRPVDEGRKERENWDQQNGINQTTFKA